MSSCSCVYVDYDGTCDFYSEKQVNRAVRQHKCDECYRVIGIGESYSRLAGKFEGDFFAMKICVDCWSLRHLFCNNANWGNAAEEIRDYILDCDAKGLFEKLPLLTPAARERGCLWIEEYWGNED